MSLISFSEIPTSSEQPLTIQAREEASREISSSFPLSNSISTSFHGFHQLQSSNNFWTPGEGDEPGKWNEKGLAVIFSSSGGRSNDQGRNAAIRNKIYEQDEKIEQLTRKKKKKKEKRQKKIEDVRSIESSFKVEEVKEEEFVNPFDVFPFAKEFQEKHPELLIEFAPPPEVPSFLAEANVICFNPWCKDHLTRAEPKEERREDPLTLHSLAKKMEALNKENKELHERFYKLEVNLCNLNDRIQQLESSSLANLVD